MNRLTQTNFRCKTVFCLGNSPENAVSQIFFAARQDGNALPENTIKIASRKKRLVFLQKNTKHDAYLKSVCLFFWGGYIHISSEKTSHYDGCFIHPQKGLCVYNIYRKYLQKSCRICLPYLTKSTTINGV